MGWPEDITESTRAGRRRVLVVDDNQDIAISASWLLEHEGHEVRVAFDGLNAVEVAREFHPDVAILDVGLPGINGYEVARRLRHALGSNVLIIIITAYSQDDLVSVAGEAQFDLFFMKPLDFSVISDILSSAS